MVNIKQYSVLSGVVRESLVLTGTISKKIEAVERHEKAVTIEENGTFEILPDDGNVLSKVTVTAQIKGGGAEEYEGDYSVTPTVDGQTLMTANKYMSDDLTIEAIPTFEVSNDSGGKTFYIAKG
jgi:hypothetical protein